MLVDRTNRHGFQPLRYRVAAGVLAPEDIAVPIRSVLARAPNVRVIAGEVTAVDPDRREVHMEPGGVVPYDRLILAAGARHAYLAIPPWKAWAPGLKTLADALKVRRRIVAALEAVERDMSADAADALPSFVVVGGGPTGVELAGALADIVRQEAARSFPRVDTGRIRVLLLGSRTPPPARVSQTFGRRRPCDPPPTRRGRAFRDAGP